MAAVSATFGRLDILVNNAGLGTNHDAIDATEAEWDELFAVNVRGLFFASQAAARRMLPKGSGRIINMASQAGLVGIRRHAAYSASKAAVIGPTKVLALEWSPHGVTVNAVAPTWTYTPGTAELLDDPEFLATVLAPDPGRSRRHNGRDGRRLPVSNLARGGDGQRDGPHDRWRLDSPVARVPYHGRMSAAPESSFDEAPRIAWALLGLPLVGLALLLARPDLDLAGSTTPATSGSSC